MSVEEEHHCQISNNYRCKDCCNNDPKPKANGCHEFVAQPPAKDDGREKEEQFNQQKDKDDAFEVFPRWICVLFQCKTHVTSILLLIRTPISIHLSWQIPVLFPQVCGVCIWISHPRKDMI
jgi:hypothetical protein